MFLYVFVVRGSVTRGLVFEEHRGGVIASGPEAHLNQRGQSAKNKDNAHSSIIGPRL